MFRINRIVQICVFLNFILSLQFLFVGGTIVNVSKTIKIDNFLAQITQSHFPNCALFFFRQQSVGNLLGENVLTGMLTQLKGSVPYYNVIYTPSLELNNVISSTNSSHRLFPISLNSYNRKAPVCKLAILNVDDLRDEFLLKIKRLIVPPYIPMVRKDSDAWILITSHPNLLEPLLLSEALPGRTKYKLGISIAPTSGDLVVKSVCFFCNEGAPAIVNLPITDPTNFNYFPDYVLNLNGKVLKVTCPAIKTGIELDPKNPFGINNAQRGMWKTLFDEYLMIKFNFTYNMFISIGKDGGKGGGTGLELPNGTWIGTIGDLIEGRADIGIFSTNTEKRIQQVSFSNSFFDINYLNFITTHGAKIFSPAALFWPFDLLMWTAILASTLAAFGIFKALTYSMTLLGMDSGDEMQFAHRGVVVKKKWGIQHQMFFVATSYLDQDCVLPRFSPLRCFVAFWLFFTLIITTVYRSKMVSLLAFPIIAQIPLTFEELIATDYQVGFVKHGDSALNTLKASTDPVYVKLVANMEIITGSGMKCLERAVAKKYACIAYKTSTVYLKARNLSDSDTRKLVFAPELTYFIVLGLAFESGLYKEGFERWLGWTRPFHLTHLWEENDLYYNVRLPKRQWWLETNQTDKLAHSDAAESDDLTLKHISGAFYALAACLFLSFVVFIQEILFFNWKKVQVFTETVFQDKNPNPVGYNVIQLELLE